MEDKVNAFQITPRVIAHLGENLIKNESIALLELIKNSYDAKATQCEVFFEEQDGRMERIIITDNGTGMNDDIIRNVWLVIGTDHKKKILEQETFDGRYPLGEKGIGRLGVHKLGNKIRLISKMLYQPEVELNIDWSKLDEVETIDEFPVHLVEHTVAKEFQQGATGTKIIIESLKSQWDRRQLREVYRNIMSLNSPFEDTSDQFKVNVQSNNPRLFAGLPAFADIIAKGGMYYGHCKMSGNMIKEFKYEFKPWSTLTKVSSGRTIEIQDLPSCDLTIKGFRDVDIDRRPELYEIDLSTLKIGDVEFDIVIFEKDSAIFNFAQIERTAVNEYLAENGGIRVYRDNVRIYNYGERDNDWLGVDLKRVNRAGGNISNNVILGAVRLKRKESLGLEEKTNREGFIENDIYIAFRDAINYVLSLFVRYRNEDKEQLTTLYKQKKVVEPVLGELKEAVALVEQHLSESKAKETILRSLKRVDEEYRYVKNVLLKSATTGMNLSVVIHEIDKLVAALMGSAERGETNRVLILSRNIEEIVRGYTQMIKTSASNIQSLSEAAYQAIDNYKFRYIDHHIKVIHNCANFKLSARFVRSQTIAIIDNLLDNSIFWLGYGRIENPIISVYLTDQIKGYHSVIISDNGPGFNIAPEVAVKPFISGKPNDMGMGLGLHLANEVMNEMKGKLVFYGKDDLELPEEVVNAGATRAIIALCFPIQ